MSDVSAPITWRGRVTAVLIGLLLLGIAAEPVLRIAMPNWSEYHSGRFMMRLNVPDQPVTSIGVPGFDGWFSQNNGDFRVRIRINEFGLRNDQPANAADNRIWILGDSMSFGWGVERTETYTQILADRLGAGTYNVATPGSSVCGWQTLYSRMPRELRPTAVVVGLTIENRMGLYDCTAEARVVPLAPEPVSPSLSAAKTFLTEHSAVYNFFTVSLKRIGPVQTALMKLGLINDPGQVLLHGQDPAKAPQMIESTAGELRRLRAMAAGRPFLVVLFPARFELRDGNPYFQQLRAGIADALKKEGIDTLDLYPDFKAAGFSATHFAHDGHWNARGHQVAGEALARWFTAYRGAQADERPGGQAQPAPGGSQR